MSAFIKLNKQDAFITPYTAHKSYSYLTNQERIAAGIRFRLGNALSSSRSGDIIPTNLNRFHSSVKQLYYSNYSSSLESGSFENYNQSTLHFTRSLGDNLAIISVPRDIYGENIKPTTFKFSSGSIEIYDDGEGNLFSSGTVSYSAHISTSIDSVTTNFTDTGTTTYDSVPDPSTLILNIPLVPFTGSLDRIEWTGAADKSPFYLVNGTQQVSDISESADLTHLSFTTDTRLESSDVSEVQFQDNSEYRNIIFYFTSSSIENTSIDYEIYPSASINDGEYLGNIFYSHGMAVLTKSDIAHRYQEQVLRSGSLEWKGAYTIFEHTYQCRSNQSQLNYSQNPSTFTNVDISGSLLDNVTGSYFQPYVTSIGLYNDANELIAIGKLAQPIPKSQYNDMTFAIKFDA